MLCCQSQLPHFLCSTLHLDLRCEFHTIQCQSRIHSTTQKWYSGLPTHHFHVAKKIQHHIYNLSQDNCEVDWDGNHKWAIPTQVCSRQILVNYQDIVFLLYKIDYNLLSSPKMKLKQILLFIGDCNYSYATFPNYTFFKILEHCSGYRQNFNFNYCVKSYLPTIS